MDGRESQEWAGATRLETCPSISAELNIMNIIGVHVRIRPSQWACLGTVKCGALGGAPGERVGPAHADMAAATAFLTESVTER